MNIVSATDFFVSLQNMKKTTIFIFFCWSLITCFCQEYDKVKTILNEKGEAKILVKATTEDGETFGGIFNLYGYFKNRKSSGCTVVNDKKRNKIFDRIKKFTSEKNFFLAIIGVIILAVSVNIVELACSAGLPVMFIEILSINNLTIVEEIIYNNSSIIRSSKSYCKIFTNRWFTE